MVDEPRTYYTIEESQKEKDEYCIVMHIYIYIERVTIIEPFPLPNSQGKHRPRPLTGSGVSEPLKIAMVPGLCVEC